MTRVRRRYDNLNEVSGASEGITSQVTCIISMQKQELHPIKREQEERMGEGESRRQLMQNSLT